ncbi:MAG: HlyD family efflux transporter periplasmic adaptor subunit [Pirellulales bacterium]|nr:HlyD family efflux transporter periplasmic adaptor subunit [Pirellulales bacterium]
MARIQFKTSFGGKVRKNCGPKQGFEAGSRYWPSRLAVYGLALCVFAVAAPLALAQNEQTILLKLGRVKLRDEVRIPASEAGVLITYSVREGSRVSEGDVLAVIDDREAQARLKIAQYALAAAAKRALNTIEEEFASKSAEVAKVDWEKAVKANLRKKDAVPEIEVMQKYLAYQRARLQTEKAQKDQELAKLDARTKKAELDAAQLAIEWRTIRAPFAGEVVASYHQEKEWVNPGDPILKLVRFDKLYVEDTVDSKVHNRDELVGCDVVVEVTRARGKKISVAGTVVYVEQSMQLDGGLNVRAEVENTVVNDSWLIQPGMSATMTLHLGTNRQRDATPSPQAGLTRRRGN